MNNYAEVAHVLINKDWETPKKGFIFPRKGKGIFSRKVFEVDAKDVRQHVQRGKTVAGSKQCRQFTDARDVGSVGDVRMRVRSCHFCNGCLTLDASLVQTTMDRWQSGSYTHIANIKKQSLINELDTKRNG